MTSLESFVIRPLNKEICMKGQEHYKIEKKKAKLSLKEKRQRKRERKAKVELKDIRDAFIE